jgi:hypothetical protein
MSTSSTSTIKLTDAQLVALSAASQHADRCIVPPEHLKGGATSKFTSSLMAKGVAEEIDAAPGMPIIRRDGHHAFALVITAAGFAALGIEVPDAADALPTASSEPDAASRGDRNSFSDEDGPASGDRLIANDAGSMSSAGTSYSTARSATPREGTKLAQVIGMLERTEGAAISELMSVTGWLAHTTRAALTGLRKRGYTVELEKGPKDQESRYRITAMPIVAKAA